VKNRAISNGKHWFDFWCGNNIKVFLEKFKGPKKCFKYHQIISLEHNIEWDQ
jgi:hypothetical protein